MRPTQGLIWVALPVRLLAAEASTNEIIREVRLSAAAFSPTENQQIQLRYRLVRKDTLSVLA
jgi:hypothetical protein